MFLCVCICASKVEGSDVNLLEFVGIGRLFDQLDVLFQLSVVNTLGVNRTSGGIQGIVLNDLHRGHPEVAALVCLNSTDVLDLVATLESCRTHWAGDGDLCAVFNISDRQGRCVGGVRHDAAQTEVAEDVLHCWEEVAQFKVVVASKLVVARLVELGVLQGDTRLHQFFMNTHD